MKNKSIKKLYIVAVVIFIFLSCNQNATRDNGSENSLSYSENADLTGRALHQADSLLSEMTLEQKVGVLFMPAIKCEENEKTSKELLSYIHDWNVGGILLMNGDMKSARSLAELGSMKKPGIFVAIDAEWGLAMRLKDAQDFPKNGKISPEADESALYDYGREVARQCRSLGVNMVMGPVLDVADNPGSVIGTRSYGKDPKRVADLGVAYAKGLESEGVLTVAKHFPGHGATLTDTHNETVTLNRNSNDLSRIDVYPFVKYIENGLSGIMVGHLAVPALDDSNLPASFSEKVITGLLKDSLNFTGLIFTDALNMKGAEGHDAVEALKAGADMIIYPENLEEEINKTIEAVLKGDLPYQRIEESARKLLFYRYLSESLRASSIKGESQEVAEMPYDSIYSRLKGN